MKKLFKKNKKTIISISIIILISFLIFNFSKEKEEEYNFSIAEKQNLIQEISATGRVKAVDDIALAFEKSGRIKTLPIKIGDKVSKGKILASLESDDIYAELAQARASVSSAEAKLLQYDALLEKEESALETLEIGTRQEEIIIYESKVKNAEAVYNASIQNIVDKIGDAYTKSDDAIRNKIDQMFRDPRGSNPELTFSVNDSQLEINIELNRSLLEQKLITWNSSLPEINEDSMSKEITNTENNLNQIKSFLDDIALAVNNLYVNSEFSQTTIDGYKADIYTARNNINTAITNLSSAKEKLNTANTSLLIVQNELALKNAANTPEAINSQKASVKQAKANIISQEAEIDLKESMVLASLAKLSKNTLISPIAGTITRQETRIGEIVSGGEIIISVISEDDLEIETNIVEADIAYLKIGNKAVMSLDAYGEDTFFSAEIIKIDPAATLIEGVANYKATLKLNEINEKIKAGMTADLDIITLELENVLAIPYRAVIFRNGSGKVVRVLNEKNEIEERQVEIGITGKGSMIEIKEGINEGDKVVTSIKD